MRFPVCASVIAGTLTLSTATLSETRALELRRDESTIAYSVPVASALSELTGEFKAFDVVLMWDEADLDGSSLFASIDADSVETGTDAIDTRLKGPYYFDTENHPRITFRSREIERRGNGFLARGLFSLRGTTKVVEFPFRVVGTRDRMFAFTSRWSFNRHDYGIGAGTFWGRFIGDEITIHIALSMRESPQ